MTTATGIYLDTPAFRKAAKEFTSATGKELHVLTSEVMRVLVETLYHWTAPPTKGNTGSRGGREGGMAMINQDVHWIVHEPPNSWLMNLYKRYGNTTIVGKEWRKKDGEVWLIDQVTIDTTGNLSTIDQWHKKNRKSRGRVLTHAGSVTEDIGRWKPRNKMFVPKGTKDRYIQSVHKRVGKMKAGWSEALKALKSTRVPAAWVKSAGSMAGHFGTASGSYSEKLDTENWSGDMVALNTTAYGRDQDAFQQRAHEYVQKNVLQKRMETWLESMIKKHSKVQ